MGHIMARGPCTDTLTHAKGIGAQIRPPCRRRTEPVLRAGQAPRGLSTVRDTTPGGPFNVLLNLWG